MFDDLKHLNVTGIGNFVKVLYHSTVKHKYHSGFKLLKVVIIKSLCTIVDRLTDQCNVHTTAVSGCWLHTLKTCNLLLRRAVTQRLWAVSQTGHIRAYVSIPFALSRDVSPTAYVCFLKNGSRSETITFSSLWKSYSFFVVVVLSLANFRTLASNQEI